MKKFGIVFIVLLAAIMLTGCTELLQTLGLAQDEDTDIKENVYTVTYYGNNSNGGTVPSDSNNYEEGSTVTVAGAGSMTRAGYAFTGWNTAADGMGTQRAVGSTFNMGTGNITLYAQWVDNIIETKFNATDGAANDKYGVAVSISPDGSLFVVGSVYDDNESGSIYVYRFDGSNWIESKLTASDRFQMDHFGVDVTISSDNNTICAGAIYEDAKGVNSGSIYIYKWDGSDWNETKLAASDGSGYDYFGRSIATSSDGNTLVVGAYYDDVGGTESGSIYVYKWDGSTWGETKLAASDGSTNEYFGQVVAMSSDENIVFTGVPGDSDLGSNSGSVYIYRWDGSDWNESKLTASDGAPDDRFGGRISISSDGNTLVAGSIYDDDNGVDSGSIYVFKWDGSNWSETKITASDGAADDWQSYNVSISPEADVIVAGAVHDDDSGEESGSIYFYKWDGSNWSETKIIASDGAADDFLGFSVSVSSNGSSIISGSIQDDDEGGNSGSAYLFTM